MNRDDPKPAARPPLFVPIGGNSTRVYGLDAETRAYRLAGKAGYAPGREDSLSGEGGRSTLLADLDYAWDPAWLIEMRDRPGDVLVHDDRAVMAHCTSPAEREAALKAMRENDAPGPHLKSVDSATAEISYHALRKRDRPFVMPLREDNAIEVERAAYDASYKGVTDILTLYLWRRPAFYLTRWAALAGMTPNMVTAIGAAFMILAFFLFWQGQYWLGMAAGLFFMVLDTVDGKLARGTGTSSYWGNIFDHGIDLVHPPFWWWAWAMGLAHYQDGSLAFEPVYGAGILAAIIGGYVVQRVIEGWFMRRFGMHIHVWQQVDSRFRLITARRNPNMVILFFATLFGRPDVGLELVALWVMISLIFHAVRLAQAEGRHLRGQPVTSWLS